MKFDRPCNTSVSSLLGWLNAKKWLMILAVLFGTSGLSNTSVAQLRVDISGTGAQQYPVAIADFSGEPAGNQCQRC